MKLSAARKWYAAGFAVGAAGGKPTQRKGKPRIREMRPHWRRGILDGAWFSRQLADIYVGGLMVGTEQLAVEIAGAGS